MKVLVVQMDEGLVIVSIAHVQCGLGPLLVDLLQPRLCNISHLGAE